jgi:hypothetical protein
MVFSCGKVKTVFTFFRAARKRSGLQVLTPISMETCGKARIGLLQSAAKPVRMIGLDQLLGEREHETCPQVMSACQRLLAEFAVRSWLASCTSPLLSVCI